MQVLAKGSGLLTGIGLGLPLGEPRPDDSLVIGSYLNDGARRSAEALSPLVLHPETLPVADTVHRWTSPGQVQTHAPGLRADAAASLLAGGRNARPPRLEPRHLDQRIQVLRPTQEELSGIFDAADRAGGWERFYATFPRGALLVRFTNVGYDVRFQQAVFAMSTLCGPLCGSGGLIVMERQASRWQVVTQRTLWMS
jgi:hypothetical protein